MAEIRINATGGVKLYDADDSHYAQIIAGTITSNVDVLTLGHASADFSIPVTATTFEPDGDTAASDNAAIGYTSAEGLILTGQGSTNDVTIKNDADADVITIATGATNVDVVGDLTAGTLNADGDTAAGDNAAIGYTAGEGLILTGQGSTSDVTLKNDADGTVFTVPTGTDDILFPDSAKAMLGAASDMTLYHDGTNSYITNAVGALKIATETSGIALTIGHTTSEVTIGDNLTTTGTMTVGSTVINTNGVTEVDQYRLTANLDDPGTADITANLERVDDALFGRIGTGMSESSGIYTFPSTGIWRVQCIAFIYIADGDDGSASVLSEVSSDSGSNYDTLAKADGGNAGGGQSYATYPSECFVDVTNASTFRFKFRASSMASTTLLGDTGFNTTSFSFMRLGDT